MKHCSPLVYQFYRGHIELEHHGAFKDVIVDPAGAECWDASQPLSEAVLARLVREAETVVVGLGTENLEVPDAEMLAQLRAVGMTIFMAETHKAVQRYNELVQDEKRVAGVFRVQ